MGLGGDRLTKGKGFRTREHGLVRGKHVPLSSISATGRPVSVVMRVILTWVIRTARRAVTMRYMIINFPRCRAGMVVATSAHIASGIIFNQGLLSSKLLKVVLLHELWRGTLRITRWMEVEGRGLRRTSVNL